MIVSLDNKQWHFDASSSEEREEWVHAIEQQILSSLQTNETNKLKVSPRGNLPGAPTNHKCYSAAKCYNFLKSHPIGAFFFLN